MRTPDYQAISAFILAAGVSTSGIIGAGLIVLLALPGQSPMADMGPDYAAVDTGEFAYADDDTDAADAGVDTGLPVDQVVPVVELAPKVERVDRKARTKTLDPIIALEPLALQGKLTYGDTHVLERTLARTERQTRRDKISRLLLRNAQQQENWGQWKLLAERHITEIDRSDPSLALGYAEVVWRTEGRANPRKVIVLADLALETKERWGSGNFVRNTDRAYRLRTMAYNRLWDDAAHGKIVTHTRKRFLRGDEVTEFYYPDVDDQRRADLYRARVKDAAVDWCDFREANDLALGNAEVIYATAVPGGVRCGA